MHVYGVLQQQDLNKDYYGKVNAQVDIMHIYSELSLSDLVLQRINKASTMGGIFHTFSYLFEPLCVPEKPLLMAGRHLKYSGHFRNWVE